MHANDFDIGIHRLDVVGHTRDEAPAANGYKHGVQAGAFLATLLVARLGSLVRAQNLHLAQHFHGHRALTSNHVGVIKGMHKGESLFLLQREGMAIGIGITVTKQNHFATKAAHRIHLDLGRGGGHHDDSAGAQATCAQGHALRMVARRGANDAGAELRGRQVRHLVIGAAQLEAAYRLLIFPLQQHRVVQAAAKVARRLQCGFLGNVIDARRQDFLEVVGGCQCGERRGRLGG